MLDGGADADPTLGCRQEFTIDAFVAQPDLLAGRRDHFELAGDTITELRLLAQGIARVVPSLCGVLLTVTDAGVAATVRLAVAGEDRVPVASSLQLPLSASPEGGMVVFQASVPQAFDQLARDATVLLPDGGLGVVLDRHLSRTTANQSAGDVADGGLPTPAADLTAALSGASLVNQALGVLLAQGYLPADAAVELDRRARAAGVSLVTVAAQMLHALTGGPPRLGETVRRRRPAGRASTRPETAGRPVTVCCRTNR